MDVQNLDRFLFFDVVSLGFLVRQTIQRFVFRTLSRNHTTCMIMMLIPFGKLSVWHLDQLVAPRPII